MRIFCEGRDDKVIINQLLKHLEGEGTLNAWPEYSKYIEDMGGKSKLLELNNYAAVTKKIQQKNIRKALFIFDADFKADNQQIGGLTNSEASIKKLIEELDWGIEIDYYIFDNNLDDFIIKTLDKDQQQCFKQFDKCLDIEGKNKNKKISTCIYKKLYPQSPYDFSHQNFNELKQKLIKLFE